MTCSTERLRLNDRAYLLVRNPSSAFVCWTWSGSSAQAFNSMDYEPDVLVRLSAAEDKNQVVEHSVRWDTGGIYLRLPAEGRTYSASVYVRKKDGHKEKLLESNAALAPVSLEMSGLSSGYASPEFLGRNGGI